MRQLFGWVMLGLTVCAQLSGGSSVLAQAQVKGQEPVKVQFQVRLPGGPAQPAAVAGTAPAQAVVDAELKQLVDRYSEAFNKADIPGLLALFTPDARLYDTEGTVLEGTKAIGQRFEELFASEPGLTLKAGIDELRLISPEVAVETGIATATTKAGVGTSTRYHALHVKRNQHWQTAEIREFSAPELVANANHRLSELAWLLGDWQDESPAGVVRYKGAWENLDTRRFLVRPFTVTVKGKPVVTGSHRLGFDPTLGQIRGWMFDSDGGFSEEFWYPTGANQWVIKSSGVDAQGERVTATHLLTYHKNHTARLSVLDHSVAGQALPAGEQHHIARPPAEPAK